MASGSTLPASEHATAAPATRRGNNSFLMCGNMALRGATGNCRDLAIGPQRVALIDRPGIPQHPGLDAELLSRANLFADLVRGVARLAATQRERLQVGANHGRIGEATRAIERLAQRVAHHAIRLAIRAREP